MFILVHSFGPWSAGFGAETAWQRGIVYRQRKEAGVKNIPAKVVFPVTASSRMSPLTACSATELVNGWLHWWVQYLYDPVSFQKQEALRGVLDLDLKTPLFLWDAGFELYLDLPGMLTQHQTIVKSISSGAWAKGEEEWFIVDIKDLKLFRTWFESWTLDSFSTSQFEEGFLSLYPYL